jgi:uracil-DNA glycosylase family 4
MDAREQLRLYLEQRRESGERDLVLDQLSVDAVLSLIGAPTDGSRASTDAAPRAAEPTPALDTPPPVAADWRDVLRSSGAAPQQHADTGGTLPPAGLSVGDADHELFSALAHLSSLDDVANTIATCTRCPLYSTATKPVPGVGNAKAELMVVGEAPGQTEDETGLPFVGAAGQLLTKILAAVDFKREDVFIVNVLKHRPPGNRNPMPDEVTACSPFLFRQFELIRPKAVLALGTFAAQTLLQTKLAIGKLRGQVHRFHGVPLIVTYHPAALLRNPSWKRPTWEDVQLVRRILDNAQPQS